MTAARILDAGAITSLIASYGYVFVFAIVACESAGLPLPGETVLVSAAVYAGTTHRLDIAGIVAAAVAGAVLGDNVGFWAGRVFGPALLARLGPKLGLDLRRQRLGQYLFERHGGKLVFFGRFVALLRAFAALLAGVNRMPPIRFVLFNAAGAIVWASVFGIGGYLAGASFHKVTGPVGTTLLIVALISGFLLWRFYKRHEEALLQRAETAMSASRASGSASV